jgi:hypothetical protein
MHRGQLARMRIRVGPAKLTHRFDGRPVTRSQWLFLTAIERLWIRHLCAPTVRELCDELGIHQGGGNRDTLLRLRRKGLVTWIYGQSRTLRTTRLRVAPAPGGMILMWGGGERDR